MKYALSIAGFLLLAGLLVIFFYASGRHDGQISVRKSVDPITRLERKLEATNGVWMNGFFVPIELPENTPIENVLQERFKRPVREGGFITDYTIIEKRYLNIFVSPGESRPIAVLISCNLGYEIAVAVFSEKGAYWNVRVYPGWE